jgi:hypothetical protein
LANWYRKFLVFGFVILSIACSEDSEIKLQVWPQCPDVFGEKTFRFYGDNPQEIKEVLPLQRYVSTLTALSRDDSFGPREELGDMDIIFAPISIAPSANCDGLVLEKLMLVGAKVSDEKLEAAVILAEGMPYSYAPQICSAQNMIWMKELGYTHRDITRLKSGRITNDFTFDLDQCKRWQELHSFKNSRDENDSFDQQEVHGERDGLSGSQDIELNLSKQLSKGLVEPLLLEAMTIKMYSIDDSSAEGKIKATAILDEIYSRCSAVQVTNLALIGGDPDAFTKMGKFIAFKADNIYVGMFGMSETNASAKAIRDHELSVEWYQNSMVGEDFVSDDKLLCEKLLAHI